MSSFATYMDKLQELTQKNLDILNLLNDSMYSKQLHNEAIIGGTTYSIPSFIYIENKLNELEGDWRRLINAPRTGEAAFVFDGNTQRIQVRGFENSPEPIKAKRDEEGKFYIENNDIFKDFISPLIYLKYNLEELPEDINTVSVRKIAIHNKSIFDNIESSGVISWANVSAALAAGTEDIDYVLYDKIYKLPIKKNDVVGKFNLIKYEPIKTSSSSIQYTVELDNVTYTYDSESLERNLAVDDFIITQDDRCTFRVIAIDIQTKILKIEVVSGYVNPSSIEYFKFWKKQDFSEQKYIKVPLEEDQYIVIFIAPINSNLNVQSGWGIGQAIDVYNLKSVDGDLFKTVYDEKIRNIGDVLYDLTKFTTTSLSNIGESGLRELTSYKPTFKSDLYKVELLNEHLLDNSTVDLLRKLNVQKTQISADLQSIQDNIDKINSSLATTDFSNQNIVTRQDLEASLEEFNIKRSQSLANLNNIINQISIASEESNLPISRSKYVIKGSIDVKAIHDHFKDTSKAQVIHIDLLYRYKNINKDVSKATTLSEAVTVSSWNRYNIEYRQKVASFENGQIVYKFEDTNEDSTTGRWQTYQIPITLGETVDMYYRVQFDLGYPYVSTFSDWSDIVSVEFPIDIIKNTEIEGIISSNEKDSYEVAVKQTLNSEGIIGHIGDKLIDQNQVYYHRPESVASGFYTSDSKRIISLKEKLFELNNNINSLMDGTFGSNFKDLSVIASYDNLSYVISPNTYRTNVILPSKARLPQPGDDNIIKLTVLLSLTNSNANYPINIYSMYPGDNNTDINSARQSRFIERLGEYRDVVIRRYIAARGGYVSTIQLLNQIVYFRNVNLYDSSEKYSYSDEVADGESIAVIASIPNISELQVTDSVPGSYISIKPGEVISIPIQVKIKVDSSEEDKDINKTISFDVWNSPWRDPLTYTVNIFIPRTDSDMDNITESVNTSGYTATITKPENIILKSVNQK